MILVERPRFRCVTYYAALLVVLAESPTQVLVNKIIFLSLCLFNSPFFVLVDSYLPFTVPISFFVKAIWSFSLPLLFFNFSDIFSIWVLLLIWKATVSFGEWSGRLSAGSAVSSFSSYSYQRTRYSV